MTTNKGVSSFKRVKQITQKWHDTTQYTAIVVTILLILQIWWMTKGSN